MSVNATATSPLPITVDEIRMFLRDVAGQVPNTGVQNIMFDLPEFSDDDIRRAIKLTVARFNVITPPSFDNEFNINPWLLLIGTCYVLMMSEAFRQKRNQTMYSAGDIQPIGLDDKFQLYMTMADRLDQEFNEKSKAFKMSRNMEAAYGHLGSGYRLASRFYT